MSTERKQVRRTTNPKECRICADDDSSQQLISPCRCSGSLKYVHKKCLLTWIQTRGSTQCGVCLTHYTCNVIIRRIPLLSFFRRELRQVLSFAAILLSLSVILVVCLVVAFVSLNRFYTQSWSAYKEMFAHLLNSTALSLPAQNSFGIRHVRQALMKPISYRDLLAAKIAITLIVCVPLAFIWILFVNELFFVWDQYLEYDIE